MIPLQDDNPTELTPLVTITFIGMCVVAFLYQASLPPPHAETLVFQYGAIPALLFGRADLPRKGVENAVDDAGLVAVEESLGDLDIFVDDHPGRRVGGGPAAARARSERDRKAQRQSHPCHAPS